MAYRDYELDRDYGNRGNWRARSDFDRDRWNSGYGAGGYGAAGYGAGGYGDWDRSWNRASYGGWGGGGAGAYGPDYNYGNYGNYGGSYGRGEPWYGGGAGYQGNERGYGNQGFDRGYGNQGFNRASGYGGYERGYPGYGGYGGYGSNAGEWRGTDIGYQSGASRYQGGSPNWGQQFQGYWGQQNQGNWGQQSYAGRGPRNYHRSDDRIEEDVNEALTRHPGFDASEIDVKVQNGEVTLTGTVDSRQDKRMAEDAVESCPGVRDIHDQLRVSSSGSRNTEREVSRTAAQEGRSSQSGESRSGSRQSSPSRASSR